MNDNECMYNVYSISLSVSNGNFLSIKSLPYSSPKSQVYPDLFHIVLPSPRRRTHLVQSFSVVFLYWFYSIVFFFFFHKLLFFVAISSSGASSASSTLRSSSSEEDFQQILDERKRKRMLSNRESARRSRMRKQKHLDDLMEQVSQLTKDNNQILSSINITTQLYLNVDDEKSVLRAQMTELSTRLQSLNEIIDFINSSNGVFENFDQAAHHHHHHINDDTFMNPWSSFSVNQTIMASADMIMY
ncbi:bZIP transcription factor 11-like [Durio zibethinus]|uniref:BZIP transcription factor 11-like n=1 Tax=Durio zibethinus TaxID=66656 RepID=A0A6P5ZHH6_DURZI|nr:bZIP transcription factor 11-like [Durio zibethinus]